MATSGVTALRPTARDFVSGALHDNAIIPLDEEPDAAEMEACIKKLNQMLKSWSVKANLWREESYTATVLANTATLVLADDVQEVVDVRHVQSATYSRPLFQWARDQYRMLPNRTTSGNPTAFTVTRGTDGLTLDVWPVPTTDITVEIDYIRAAEIVTDPSQTLDFREEFAEAVQTNLAVRCCPIFEKQPHPVLVGLAQRLEGEMLDHDRPDSYYMVPYCA